MSKRTIYYCRCKRLNHIREVKIREGEQYTIEIDSENENDIKTNLDKNDKNLKNNNYPRQNNINKTKY